MHQGSAKALTKEDLAGRQELSSGPNSQEIGSNCLSYHACLLGVYLVMMGSVS